MRASTLEAKRSLESVDKHWRMRLVPMPFMTVAH